MATIDFSARTVQVLIGNIGTGYAGPQDTEIEINEVTAADDLKPQSHYAKRVPGIGPGLSWFSGPIPFDAFLSPRGLQLDRLARANLVVRVDGKDVVKESDERDNLYDADH